MIASAWIWLLLWLAGLIAQTGQPNPEEIWRGFLKAHLSEPHIDAHFRLHSVYRGEEGPDTVFFRVRYEDELAHTRTSFLLEEHFVSGLMRIQKGGEVQSYFGPLREYELRISREQAMEIMRTNGCEFPPTRSSAQEQQKDQRIRLFVGDYFEAGGKYSPDYIPEGFYWLGGVPRADLPGNECTVNAETGEFKIKSVSPH